MLFDHGLINGRIYLNGNWIEGNLYIKDGIISAITNRFLNTKKEYDVKGNMVLPGFIDPHVHFSLDLGKYKSVDDFKVGGMCAAYGGITTIIDFLDPVRSKGELNKSFTKRFMEAKDCCIDYAFHTTICGMESNLNDFIEESRLLGIPTIKFFTTYSSSDRRTNDDTIFKLIKASKDMNFLPLAHAENDELVKEGAFPIKEHEKNRPTISEVSEVLKLSEYAEFSGGKVYIVHVSSGITVEKVKEKFPNLINRSVLLESCPHYFYFNSNLYEEEGGELYTMTPPLRSDEERATLVNNIDWINTIGTDHCSFMKSQKQQKLISDIPMGVGGIESSFRAMYSIFGEKIIDKFTIEPAMIHGLYPYKGTLNLGMQADIVIFDPNKKRNSSSHYKCDYNLYDESWLSGEIVSTILKGRFIIKDGTFIGGKGSYIGREVK